MDNERLTEMVYNTDKIVSVLSKDVESIKQDINEFKTDSKENMTRINKKLDKLMEEPVNDMKFFKNKIFSLIISGVAVLVVLGFGTYCMGTINEANQIKQQYEQQIQN